MTNLKKKPYQGKRKVPVGKPRAQSAAKTFKKPYVAIDPPCKKCRNGVLTRRQWNRLLCTNNKCDYSELE